MLSVVINKNMNKEVIPTLICIPNNLGDPKFPDPYDEYDINTVSSVTGIKFVQQYKQPWRVDDFDAIDSFILSSDTKNDIESISCFINGKTDCINIYGSGGNPIVAGKFSSNL